MVFKTVFFVVAKVDHYNRTELIDFGLGPSTKSVLPILDAFSNKKIGVNILFVTKDKMKL